MKSIISDVISSCKKLHKEVGENPLEIYTENYVITIRKVKGW